MVKDNRDNKDAASKPAPETALIRDLANVLNDTGLTEIELEREGLRVRVVRQAIVAQAMAHPLAVAAPQAYSPPPAGTTAAPAAAPTAKDLANDPGVVKSPMVGTCYRAPEPGAAMFIEIGTRVAQGQTLVIIEAMKTMNHIQAPRAGTVKAILVENGKPVEFGEPLVVLE
jgi:acetyl-CoA carboxylase biotin carboxyl carrier protein